MVDPDYDFLTDTPSPNRKNRWSHDRFAHEFFSQSIFDGMLVSKASLNSSTEKRIREAGGLYPFTRLNPNIPIMGDCGAFSYLLQEKPIYTIQEVIDYYRDFGFTYGVSLDHLAFITVDMLEGAYKKGKLKERWWDGKTTEQIQQERFELTLENAKAFLTLHEQQQPNFTPIGIAQGGTPELYYEAVSQLKAMGYTYIALGGLIKSKDSQIVAILEHLQPLLEGIQLHIFGVARLSIIPEYMRLGVTSADSSAPLRKAFLGSGENNYYAVDGQRYAAIRIPSVGDKAGKRGVDSVDTVLKRMKQDGQTPDKMLGDLEEESLQMLRAYHRNEASLDETLQAVLTYDRLYGVKRDYEKFYRRTLTDKPWQLCNCELCQAVGVEIIIFRGNNRNRRRGFHNVKVFYDQFKEIVNNPANQSTTNQLKLGL